MPVELLSLPPLDTFTSKGLVAAPQLQLPDGKRSVFDPVPSGKAFAEGRAAPDLQVLSAELLARLAEDVKPVDYLTAVLLFIALSLGVVDPAASRCRRWLGLAAETLSWALYGLLPGSVVPALRISGAPRDVERTQASWADARQLAAFLGVARPIDRLRVVLAAERASEGDPRLAPLATLLREEADVFEPGAPLPSIDGEWECLVDYYTSGELVPIRMRINGAGGQYEVEGESKPLSEIAVRSEGSAVLASFRWANDGSTGVGTWRVSWSGDCMQGSWTQDGEAGRQFAWVATRAQEAALPEPRFYPGAAGKADGATDSRKSPEEAVLPGSVAGAIAELTRAAAREPAESREALASAWEAAVPRNSGGIYAASAVLPRRWQAVGGEMRLMLGLTANSLVPAPVQALSFGLAVAFFAITAFVLARLLAVALGSSADACAWASFAAAGAALLEGIQPDRQESRKEFLRSKEDRTRRERLLNSLCRWADAGGLRRKGSQLRGEVLEAVRKGIPEFRAESISDPELERLLRVWHPGLRKKTARGLGADPRPFESPEALRARQGNTGNPLVFVTYLNLSAPEDSRSIW